MFRGILLTLISDLVNDPDLAIKRLAYRLISADLAFDQRGMTFGLSGSIPTVDPR